MAKSKKKNQRIIQIILITFIILGIGLVLLEMGTNIANEIASGNGMVTSHQEVTPEPRPTLTTEERRELYSAPVGEEGTE